MKKEQIIVIVCALGLGVFLLQNLFSSSDEKAIDQLLTVIEYELETTQKLKPLDVAARVNNLKGLIDSNINIELDLDAGVRNYNGFDAVKQGAFAGSQLIRSSSIYRHPTDIKVNGDTATAQFQVTAEAVDSRNEDIKDRFRVYSQFTKLNGDWILKSIEISREASN